ncbi:type II toxin-antitoxin system RelE/ParE family toxin [Candidatus Hakubella thermalkaliphila]|uniref:type II toxin-antitoxin system RelE/ParE family toxin n=1 Tax=Candidatus Hakubella thermalkaliphila TaxID=2754717 RepID=UPI001594C8D0|nr:type II toxin-antitoxin system RelE/ParE family toxin [Candidatus Hakubella thermalkaliphila]
MVQIKWAKRALHDLHEIYEFIATDSPRYAQIQVERIQESVLNLAKFPSMGRQVPEFPHLPYREVLVGNYRVLYRVEEKPGRILVMSVVHGRRLLKEPPNYG